MTNREIEFSMAVRIVDPPKLRSYFYKTYPSDGRHDPGIDNMARWAVLHSKLPLIEAGVYNCFGDMKVLEEGDDHDP